MSRIKIKLYLVKTNNFSYLPVPGDGLLNQQNNKTYDLKFTNSKIIMKIKKITNHMIMYCSINM